MCDRIRFHLNTPTDRRDSLGRDERVGTRLSNRTSTYINPQFFPPLLSSVGLKEDYSYNKRKRSWRFTSLLHTGLFCVIYDGSFSVSYDGWCRLGHDGQFSVSYDGWFCLGHDGRFSVSYDGWFCVSDDGRFWGYDVSPVHDTKPLVRTSEWGIVPQTRVEWRLSPVPDSLGRRRGIGCFTQVRFVYSRLLQFVSSSGTPVRKVKHPTP